MMITILSMSPMLLGALWCLVSLCLPVWALIVLVLYNRTAARKQKQTKADVVTGTRYGTLVREMRHTTF